MWTLLANDGDITTFRAEIAKVFIVFWKVILVGSDSAVSSGWSDYRLFSHLFLLEYFCQIIKQINVHDQTDFSQKYTEYIFLDPNVYESIAWRFRSSFHFLSL